MGEENNLQSRSTVEDIKKRRKKVLTILGGIMAIIMIIGIAAPTIMSFTNANKVDPNAIIVARVKDIPLGCGVSVEFTEKGKEEYKDAEYFQIFIDDQPASAISTFGGYTTTYPKKEKGEQVVVVLFDGEQAPLIGIQTKLYEADK